jgi:hypothetical protein
MKSVFDNLVEDLLTVVYLPDWPAADVLLSDLTSLLLRSVSAGDGGKRASIDVLAMIAARVRQVCHSFVSVSVSVVVRDHMIASISWRPCHELPHVADST